jgi:hypothetical protein
MKNTWINLRTKAITNTIKELSNKQKDLKLQIATIHQKILHVNSLDEFNYETHILAFKEKHKEKNKDFTIKLLAKKQEKYNSIKKDMK